MQPKCEKELIELTIKGDMDAFEQLIAPYQKKVYNYALAFTKNHDDALELSQDVFEKVYVNIEKFEGKSSFSTWLYRITSNTCIDKSRKESKQNVLYIDREITNENSEDSVFMQIKSNRPEPAEVCLQRELRNHIIEIINQLPTEFKTVILLREVQGLSYDEIANVMNIPIGTVKSRISSARQYLREKFKKSNLVDTKNFKPNERDDSK